MADIIHCGHVNRVRWEGEGSRFGDALQSPLKCCVRTIRELPGTKLYCVIWAVVKVVLVIIAIIPSLLLAPVGLLINRIPTSAAQPRINWDPEKLKERIVIEPLPADHPHVEDKDPMRIAEMIDRDNRFNTSRLRVRIRDFKESNSSTARDFVRYAKNFLYHIDRGTGLDQVPTALDRFNLDTNQCAPTYVNVALDAIYDVCGANTPKAKITRCVMDAKEQVLRDLQNAGQWHVITWITENRGERWGLRPPINDVDGDGGRGHGENRLTLADVDLHFLENYTARLLVNCVKMSLNAQYPSWQNKEDAGFIGVLMEATGSNDLHEIRNRYTYVAEVDVGLKSGPLPQDLLNEAGVVLLLKAFGFII